MTDSQHSYGQADYERMEIEQQDRGLDAPVLPAKHRDHLGRAEQTLKRSADTAAEMHALSVRLWNELWAQAGEDSQFVDREDVERVQAILTGLAWPTVTRS
ncbi:MAG: hypothetical protein ACRDQH_06125 [Pseudonocardiaceae bacterium]